MRVELHIFKYSKISNKNEYWPFVGVQARLSLFFSILNEILSTLTSLLLENFIWIVTTHRGVHLPDAFTELLNAISSINSVSQSKIHSTNKPMAIVTSNCDPDHLSCFYCRLHPLFHCLLANGTIVHSIIGNTSHASLMALVSTNDTVLKLRELSVVRRLSLILNHCAGPSFLVDFHW